MTGR
jgi:hypothetical protein